MLNDKQEFDWLWVISTAMNPLFTNEQTCNAEDNSILAFSAASLSLCKAMVSLVISIPC